MVLHKSRQHRGWQRVYAWRVIRAKTWTWRVKVKRNVIREYLNACDAWFLSWGLRDSWIICVWSWKFRFPEVSPTIGTFSITFTANGEPEEVTWPPLCCHVCSLRFRFRREEGAPAVSDLTLIVKIFYLLWIQMSFFVIRKQCILHDLKRRKPVAKEVESKMVARSS